MQIIVDKLLTSYSLVGSGSKTILFLHGWADNAESFRQLALEIIKIGDYRAVLVDLPGFGGTQAPQTAWNLPDYAAFTSHFLKKINVQPLVIIGHSNGGAVAINGLAHKTLRADKVILIGSAGIRNDSSKKQALRLLAKPAKLAIKATPRSTQKRIRQKLYSVIGSDYLVAEHLQETFTNIVAYDVRQEAANVTIPACLIYGEDDQATPPAYGKILAGALPHATLHIIPLAGHFVHHEQLYKVARLCGDFINETAGA